MDKITLYIHLKHSEMVACPLFYISEIFTDLNGDYRMYTPDEDYQHMLDKLNAIRKQKNISKYALAKATGMSTSSMSNLLTGKTKPYLYNMLLICNVLQIPLGELLEKDNCENEEWLISAYRTMSPEKQRMLQIYADMLLHYDSEI